MRRAYQLVEFVPKIKRSIVISQHYSIENALLALEDRIYEHQIQIQGAVPYQVFDCDLGEPPGIEQIKRGLYARRASYKPYQFLIYHRELMHGWFANSTLDTRISELSIVELSKPCKYGELSIVPYPDVIAELQARFQETNTLAKEMDPVI